jgi:hypothetical protein
MGVGLEQNYGYTMWASNKAQEVADDGKITKAELTDIAKHSGNEDGRLDENDLVDAGFSRNDAKKIINELRRTGFQEVSVNFERSMLQKGVAATGQMANNAVAGTVKAYHQAEAAVGHAVHQVATKVAEVKKEVTAVVGQVKQQAAATYQAVKKTVGEVKQQVAQTYHQAKTAVVAKAGEVKEGAARLYVQGKQQVKAIGTEIANTAKQVAHNTGEFVTGVGHGIAHAGSHLVHGVAEFAKEHPVITGAVVVGAAALITVATGGVGGPVAAGVASAMLSGLSYGGIALGTAITAVKVGQSAVEGYHGNWEQAGEKFGEGVFEAAVTFAPGAGLKGLEKMAHAAHHSAHAMKATADLVESVEKVAEIEAKAAQLANQAGNLHTMEKIVHGVHEVFEAHEITSVKAPEAFHVATEVVGDSAHTNPAQAPAVHH